MNQDLSYLQDDGKGGFENIDSSVVAFPFLRVLQSLSPQLKKSDPAYLPDAEEGMIYNNVSNRAYATPLRMVVVRFQHIYTIWRAGRKGFAGYADPAEVARLQATGELIRNERWKIVDPATLNEYSETFCYYVLLPDYPEEGVCLLPLSSTQLKEARRWNRLLINTYIPGTGRKALPHFLVWNITTPVMRNDQGSWSGFRADFAGYVGPDDLKLVTAERAALPSQDTKVDFTGMNAGSETTYADNNSGF